MITVAAALLVLTAPARFAIVVGNNHPLPGSNYELLQYADDDAIRFARFFSGIGAEVSLLTAPDAETAARFAGEADRAESPTRERVLAAIEKVRAQLTAGAEVYFYYSGHGSVTSVDAFIHLSDGPFTRTDLHQKLLRSVNSDRLHVIIDSCHSYFLVNARGERVAVDRDELDLGRYPNAGFLLSTSSRKEVHEWSGYQAGVFSYQVLGALQGAADVDRDGIVSYGELQAYVVAANLGVVDPRARIEPFIRRPAIRGGSMVDLRALGPSRRAIVPEALEGHFHVLDGEGRRVLDANKPSGLALELIVPEEIRGWELELGARRFELERQGERALFVPAAEGRVLAARGRIADELRAQLFARPLTPEFVAGVEAAVFATPIVETAPPPPAIAWSDDPLTLGMLGIGGVAALTGVVGTVLFLDSKKEADVRPVTNHTEAALDRAQDQRVLMVAAYVASGVLLTAGLIRAFQLGDGGSNVGLSVGPGRAGLAISGSLD